MDSCCSLVLIMKPSKLLGCMLGMDIAYLNTLSLIYSVNVGSSDWGIVHNTEHIFTNTRIIRRREL